MEESPPRVIVEGRDGIGHRTASIYGPAIVCLFVLVVAALSVACCCSSIKGGVQQRLHRTLIGAPCLLAKHTRAKMWAVFSLARRNERQ
jgi:hypothetical protein